MKKIKWDTKKNRLLGLLASTLIIFIILFGYKEDSYMYAKSNYNHFEIIIFQPAPGIVYTAFLVLFFFEKIEIKIKIFVIFYPLVIYILSYFGGVYTFGLLNIITGGVRFLLIQAMLPEKLLIHGIFIFLIGAAAAGYIGFMIFRRLPEGGNVHRWGWIILSSCLPWQIIVGLLLIFVPKQKEDREPPLESIKKGLLYFKENE